MKKISLFTIALAGWVLMGCSSDEMKNGQEGQQTPITFVSNVSTMRSANVNLQKTQLAEGVKVGVFVRNADGFISGGNNAQLTASGAGGFTGSPIYFPEDGASVNVLAYAPYQSGWSDQVDVAATFTVAANQSTDAGYLASDLLHGVPTATTNSFTKETPVVALNFQHKLSKLSVKFKTSEDTDVDLKGATINIVNTLPSATLKVSDGTLGAATGTATAIKAVTFASDATEFLASAVIVPQKVAAGSFIQVVLTNGKMLNARLNTEATFASGKAYVYSVNISGQGAEAQAEIELSSTVTDWVEDATELTGDVTEEDAPEPEEVKLYATFVTPGSNATYAAPTYTWTAGNSNLMTCFEFANGELANYTKLTFTFSNLVDGPVRMGYYVGSAFTEFGNGFYSAGTKTVDLTALGIDLSTVTKIAFGGRSNAGSCDIKASDVILSKE
ncbi:MAG: fimbrillin family protein [Prevotella sp.]|nr:fimbrillin family protein [Prevotella sp.]